MAKSENSQLQSENSQLRGKVHDLEQELGPFRNLAVQEFRSADSANLKRLAEMMASLRADYTTQLAIVNALREEIAVLQPKPLPQQLLAFLNELDPGILAALRTGRNVQYEGPIKQAHKDMLDRFFMDPICTNYIAFLQESKDFIISSDGSFKPVKLFIKTNLLDAH